MPTPTKRTPKLEAEVLSRLAGGETLAALGRELGFHPVNWGKWVAADEALAVAYAHARDVGTDALAEEALALIDAEPARVEGRVDPGHVAWKRAQVETRLKLLACWNPKKYGAKTQTTIGNKDGEALKVEGSADSVAIASALASALRDAKRGDKA
jgi:hypothetical protein